MESFIILSEKSWHKDLFKNIKNSLTNFNWILIDNRADFNIDNLNLIYPSKIFIPHWSYIIPSEIFLKFECIVFHMTDLPFGRGGSPLQNLIVRELEKTKISALKVEEGIDSGPIYLKSELSLLGNAEEIFIRASKIIQQMIISIIQNNLFPIEQEGSITVFKRRKPEDGNIEQLKTINKIYDYIRMLDADGYPKAFLDFEHFRIEFSRASLISTTSLNADVRIIQK